MKFSPEFNLLVIVGQWNSAILNPDWVSKYLLPDTKFNVEIPININGSMRFSTDEFRFFILDGKLFFSILKQEDAVYTKLGELALNLVTYLPHTPVIGFGLNFNFECENSSKIDSLFTFGDESDITNYGYDNSNSLIKRSFKDDNFVLNFSINKASNKYIFDFNFHFDIKTLVEFKDKFESESLLKFRDTSLNFLNTIYDLQID